MTIVDAHAHYGDAAADMTSLLAGLDVKLINICVADSDLDFGDSAPRRPGWPQQADHYRSLAQGQPDRYAWCTTFDLPTFPDSGYADRVIAGLRADFRAGAVGCKIWKNIGMQVTRPSGEFLLIDDPVLDPVISFIEESHRTLVTHTGAGGAAWLSLDDDNPHGDYYAVHPEWYMAGRTEVPGRQKIVESRDHVLERHPNLRVVGAHLACLEDELGLLATKLDRYPNFAVDTSARFPDLIRGNRAEIRKFFMAYQDRVLFGLDVAGQRLPTMTPSERWSWLEAVSEQYRTQLDYFSTAGPIKVGDRVVEGLDLPDSVLVKLLSTNAIRWYPGV